jgi:hypothetical protein
MLDCNISKWAVVVDNAQLIVALIGVRSKTMRSECVGYCL